MTGWSRDPRRPGRAPVLASIALHVVVAVVAWWAHRAASDPIEFIAYEMEFVSSAELDDPVPALPEEEVVVETPEEPAPIEPEPEPPLPDPDPDPPEEEETPPEDPPEPEPAREQPPETPPVVEDRSEEVTSTEIAVRMEGLQRDFPAYYRRIVTEIDRCFRPPAGRNLTTVVRFDIRRDGTVPGRSIQLRERSGLLQFDMAAVAAVECAGEGRLGPLPDELPWDVLPILFTFSPAGGSQLEEPLREQ